MNIKELKALSAKRKKSLKEKAKRRGMISENFGDKEIREIDESAMAIAHNPKNSWADRQEATKVSAAFFDWTVSFSL